MREQALPARAGGDAAPGPVGDVAEPTGHDVRAALERLQTAYDLFLEDYRSSHWEGVEPDPYHLHRFRFRLHRTPHRALDHEALQVIEHVTAYYQGDMAPLLPAEQIAAHACALVAEFEVRGYRGPTVAYLDGAAEAFHMLTGVLHPDMGSLPGLVGALTDDALRGFCHQVLCFYDSWLRTRDLWGLIPEFAGTGKPPNRIVPYLHAVDAEMRRRALAADQDRAT
ncbi:hypothetical protein [Thermomonospora umbrina]|uniref:Uncharacterized protein n=1 Tax=Thermomonospora umbrina TaxID=111806 RepID=A0A3D9T7J5_9ACTN|nr:hypothetical protein [Thermomonospora umbrina]REF00645.1 hypothetical protein DFJ69_6201 [Thermomonospora umbrina]